MAREAPAAASLAARLEADPGDSEARYTLAALALVNDDYEVALEHLLELMQWDRAYGEDAGRKGILAIFGLLGNQGELVERYRARLFNALH